MILKSVFYNVYFKTSLYKADSGLKLSLPFCLHAFNSFTYILKEYISYLNDYYYFKKQKWWHDKNVVACRTIRCLCIACPLFSTITKYLLSYIAKVDYEHVHVVCTASYFLRSMERIYIKNKRSELNFNNMFKHIFMHYLISSLLRCFRMFIRIS